MVHERAQRLRDATVPERHLVEVHGHERRVLGRRVLEPAGLLLPFPRRHLSGANTGYALIIARSPTAVLLSARAGASDGPFRRAVPSGL